MAADSAEAPARRFLIAAAVTDVKAHPEAERPELADDVRRMEELFLGELGYVRGARPGLDPTRNQLLDALGEFAKAPDRRPDDYVVLYLATHGITAEHSGRHYLLLHDSDARDLRRTALPTDDLVAQLWEDTAIERLLVLIDACYAEEGADTALRAALEARRFREPVTEHGSTGLVLISSSRRKEETYTGALSAAFDRAVRRQATAGHAPAHISLEHVMAAIRSDPEVPRAQRPVWSLTHATGDIPAFLPNPRHIPDADGLRLEEIDRIVTLGARERGAREQDMRGFFLPRARGTDVPTEDVWNFTGRHVAIGDVTGWLAPGRGEDRLCVVTGDPGSGKSSLLGLVAVLTDQSRTASMPRAGLPAELPSSGAVDERINASHLSTRQLLDALSAAAGCAAESLGALTAHLQTRTSPLVVLIDSLDEALAPHEVVDELLTPLTDPERRLPLRLLVGARPHIAHRLPATAPRIDLDSERYGDPDAVRAYARKLLSAQGSASPELLDAIAEAVAEAAGRSFLVARITALTIAREPRPPDPCDRRWRDELPRLPGEAMERDLTQRLGPEASRARDLLLPLAYAQGAGLPWAGVWPRLASAITGRPYGDEDIVWLRQAAGSYVVESVEDGGSVYRVYHRALIEYLREGRDPERVQRAVTEVLWGGEHPYVRRYLALHAGEGGVLDPLVQDAGFVLSCDPGQLLAALPRLRTADGFRAGQALRDLEEVLRSYNGAGRSDPELRARLRLAAVCRRAQALADSCDAGEEELPWRARWAAWNPHEGARSYPGLLGSPRRGLVVPGASAEYFQISSDDEVSAYGLNSGVRRLIAHESGGLSLDSDTLTAVPQMRGCAAAAVGTSMPFVFDTGPQNGKDWARLLHVWDHRRRTWLLPSDTGYDREAGRRPLRYAEQVAVLADAAGEPAFAALRFPGRVSVYRLGGALAYPSLGRRQRRSVSSWTEEQWEARTDQMLAEHLRTITPAGSSTAITFCAAPGALPARSLLLGYDDGIVRVVSVESGDVLAEARTGHTLGVTRIALITGHPQGRLLVTAGDDNTVRVTSLTSGEPVRTVLTARLPVASLVVHRVGRQWIVAAVTWDGQLHRFDLDSGRPIGLPLRVDEGSSVRLETFDLGPHVCVSVQGYQHGLQLYDLVTGVRIGGQVLAHEATALCVTGGTVCAGGSDGMVRLWPTEHAADSTQLTAHARAVLALGEIRGPSGVPALVSVGLDNMIRCWDPARRLELWRRRVLYQGVWTFPLMGCATTGRTADGRDLVVTGEYGGRVSVLLLRDGLPVAEQEFTVPDVVTALTTGRVRGRDVVVVGTGSGRLACWDVGAGRMFALGPRPDEPVWTTALALAPDGSGRLGVGGFDGTVREWTLPTCRPLGPARTAHRLRVCALAWVGSRLVGSGGDHRLVSYGDGWERRMPQPVISFGATDEGLLCGDETGHVWRLAADGTGWRVERVLDEVRPVPAVAVVPLDGRLAVAAGSSDGSVEVRDGGSGRLVHRLRPVCDSGVDELATVVRRSEDGARRQLLFARSWEGLLEYWDFGPGDAVAAAGGHVDLPPVFVRGRERLSVVSGDREAQSLLALTSWGGSDSATPRWYRQSKVAVHDVDDGPLLDQPCTALGEIASLGDLRAVRCAGRLLILVEIEFTEVRILDTETDRWARLPETDLVEVYVLPGKTGDELMVIGADRTRIVPWAALERRFGPDPGPAPLRRAANRLRRPQRSTAAWPATTYEHEWWHWVRFAALLPDGDSYAVSDGSTLAVIGIRDGRVRRYIELPSRCTALAAAPSGELVVGTANGLILFD
ncbi:caspase family protein [Streptomyces sp. NPDC050803]|uniref:caspase family protein n=1 Tax=unclassified Streptomyces TaxID=2593676 RepID=UPI003432A1EF